MSIKNADVMHQIDLMLKDIMKADAQQHKIIKSLLEVVYKEYNSGRAMGVERKLYDLIDAEVNFKLQKQAK